MPFQLLFLLSCCLCAILLFMVLFQYRRARQIRRQLQHMQTVLADIQAGNGKRKILAPEHAVTAFLAYQINQILYDYEEQLTSLKKADTISRQLMTSLSHDVRTPLTTLIGYLDAAHRGMVTGSTKEEYVETARQKAHELKAYIDVLFDWFKLNSGDFSLSMQPLEAAELTRNLLKDWIPVFEEHGLAYEIDIPEEQIMVCLDADGYTRILNNLIQNVISHSQAGQIHITLTVRARQLHILIRDNGVGIPAADLPHIFERLYKCDKSRSQNGNGLGLSIVRQITDNMNGTISVQSRENEGTSFLVCFPLITRLTQG